jgi:methionine-gamma-lyase
MPADRHPSLETRAVHAGREAFGDLCVHAPPLDLSTTYPVPDLEAGTASYDALAHGAASAPNPIYARMHNPTVARAENAVANLEGTEACVAFASGMAAMTSLLTSVRAAGARHILAVRPIYGGTDTLINNDALTGMAHDFVTVDEIAARIRPDTGLVVIETPANPTLDLVDIAAVVAAAGPVPVAVDSTFATPVLQNPAALGARYVMHSATKYLGGHGDVIAGMIACSEADAQPLRSLRALTGAILHPLGAYLIHQGLPTLPLRVERAQANAGTLAERLANHPAIGKVFYPGLGTVANSHLLGRQMRGPGALIAVDLKGGHEAAARVLSAVRIFTSAVSLGSVDSLIQHPAGLTHRLIDPQVLAATGITPGLLRLSIGIEGVEDLWSDLQQALAAAA